MNGVATVDNLGNMSRKLLFVMNPCTACSATGKLLRGRYGGVKRPTRKQAQRGDRPPPRSLKHVTLAELIEHHYLDVAPESLLKFTTVRNPFDVFVTKYTKRHLGRINVGQAADPHVATLGFDEWLFERFGDRQPRVRQLRYAEGMDVVLRYESLQADFRSLLQRAGVADPEEIPLSNKTIGRESDYRSYYSPESRALLEEVLAKELEQLGYAF